MALAFLVLTLWIDALILAIIYTGPVGVGIVIVAFIVWRIIKRKRQKKQEATKADLPDGAVPSPAPPEDSDQNEGREKTLV